MGSVRSHSLLPRPDQLHDSYSHLDRPSLVDPFRRSSASGFPVAHSEASSVTTPHHKHHRYQKGQEEQQQHQQFHNHNQIEHPRQHQNHHHQQQNSQETSLQPHQPDSSNRQQHNNSHQPQTSHTQIASTVAMEGSLSGPFNAGAQSHMPHQNAQLAPLATTPTTTTTPTQQQSHSAHGYSDPNSLQPGHRPALEQERQHSGHQYYQQSRSEQATPAPTQQPRSYSVDSGSYVRAGPYAGDGQNRPGLVAPGRMEGHAHPTEQGGYHQPQYAVAEQHQYAPVHHNTLPLTSPHDQQHNPLPSPAGPNYPMQPTQLYATQFSYGPTPANQQQPTARRKHVRASQACNQCRQRKQKCDELRPCSFCREAGLGDQCHYKDVQAPKQDRAITDISGKVDKVLDLLRILGSRVTKVEKVCNSAFVDGQVPPVSRSSSSNPGAFAPSMKSPGGRNYFHLSDIFPDDFTDPSKERKGGDHVLAIPPRHTTGAHKLLTYWSEVMAPLMKIKGTHELVVNNENYAFEAEDARGLLRLYGVGEGHDEGDGTQASPVNGADSDVSSPSPRACEGLWGATLTPSSGIDSKRPEDPCIGGVNVDGSLKVDEPTVRRLFRSFFANIQVLHPFLEKKRITTLVDRFIQSYSPMGPTTRSPFATPTVPEPATSAPLKRKRSGGTTNSPSASSGTDQSSFLGPRQPIERSIRNALVLLVLALGRITEVKTPLQGPVRNSDLYAPMPPSGSPYRTATETPPSTFKESPGSSQFSVAGFTSAGMEGTRVGSLSRQSSTAGAPYNEREPLQKNVDRIPGLAYYAKATEILGNVHCGNDLSHVQACLLAGLYMGQLGRVLESWSWINSACRACQYVVDKERDLLKREKQELEAKAKLKAESAESGHELVRDVRKDLITLAFWTCLQLESDILAELNLPPSGISAYEDDVPLPAGVTLDMPSEYPRISEDVIVLLYYSAQIQLRKILNRAHTVLYGRNDHSSQQTGWKAFDPRDLEWSLAEWRKTLPTVLSWDDSDPPASDINAARMRAKYYGARYIINRPFLRFAVLNMSPQPIEFLSEQDSPHDDAEFNHHSIYGSDIVENKSQHPQDKRVDKQKILRAAKRCIDAAMNSTVALDNVDGRLIVTNIWGTSHAQFGNNLVLAATYGSWLGQLVQKDRLVALLQRTINHLAPLRQLSPTLSYDHRILMNVLANVEADNTNGRASADPPNA